MAKLNTSITLSSYCLLNPWGVFYLKVLVTAGQGARVSGRLVWVRHQVWVHLPTPHARPEGSQQVGEVELPATRLEQGIHAVALTFVSTYYGGETGEIPLLGYDSNIVMMVSWAHCSPFLFFTI